LQKRKGKGKKRGGFPISSLGKKKRFMINFLREFRKEGGGRKKRKGGRTLSHPSREKKKKGKGTKKRKKKGVFLYLRKRKKKGMSGKALLPNSIEKMWEKKRGGRETSSTNLEGGKGRTACGGGSTTF